MLRKRRHRIKIKKIKDIEVSLWINNILPFLYPSVDYMLISKRFNGFYENNFLWGILLKSFYNAELKEKNLKVYFQNIHKIRKSFVPKDYSEEEALDLIEMSAFYWPFLENFWSRDFFLKALEKNLINKNSESELNSSLSLKYSFNELIRVLG